MADQRELFEDHEEAQRAGWAGLEKRMFTNLVAVVTEDSDGHTLTAQVVSKRRDVDENGKVTWVDYPLLVDLPVHFPSGGGASFTFPIKKGDECLVSFSCRSIDSWHQNGSSGGSQVPSSTRMHHISDGVAMVGLRSTPRKLNPPPSKVSAQMRSDDGKHVVDLDPAKGISHTSTMAVTIDAPSIVHKGNVTVQPRDDGTGGNLMISQVNQKGGNLIVSQAITAKSVTETG